MPNKPVEGLTDPQRDALRVYLKYIDTHGEPPSVRQFAAELGTEHPNAAHYYITVLRDKGYLADRPITIIRPTLSRKGKRNT